MDVTLFFFIFGLEIHIHQKTTLIIMANKRDLKRSINYITSELFAETMAAVIYSGKVDKEAGDNLLASIIITRDDLLELGHPNKAEQKYISDSKYDYYDVVEVIKHAFEITDEINVYMLNLILQKEWLRFITARYTVIDHIGTDWQGAFLIKTNPKYPEDHLLYLSQTDISKNAMDSIRSIAARSLFDKR